MRKKKLGKKLPLQLAEEQAQFTWALGNSYESAAIQLIRENKPKIFIPTLVLFLHALELYLKAFLFFQHCTNSNLRSIGHDLVLCMRECCKYGLSKHVKLTRSAILQVIRVNRYYSDKELEYYIVPRNKRFGSIDTLAETVSIVAKGIGEFIVEKSFKAIQEEKR